MYTGGEHYRLRADSLVSPHRSNQFRAFVCRASTLHVRGQKRISCAAPDMKKPAASPTCVQSLSVVKLIV